MRTSAAAVLAGVLLVLAGCGGGSGGGDATGTANEQEAQLAYESGYQQCTGFSLKDLAATYSAKAATPEAVAEAVARGNAGQPQFIPATVLGCKDAIAGKPLRQSGQFDPRGDTNPE